MNILKIRAISLLIISVMSSKSALSHHAFAAEFDAKSPVLLKGTIVKKELINPHCWIHIDVTREDGVIENWKIEGGTPNTLLQSGITNESTPIGTEVVIRGYQSKDKDCSKKCKAYGRDIMLASGQQFFMSPSNTNETTNESTKGSNSSY